MALSRSGFRSITVGGDAFYWRVIDHGEPSFPDGSPGRLVDVVAPVAFESGKRGQVLRFTLPLGWVVTPRLVRWAIEDGAAGTPPFTGAAGQADLVLDPAQWLRRAERRMIGHLGDLLEAVEPSYRASRAMVDGLADVGEHRVALEMLEDHAAEVDAPAEFWVLVRALLSSYPTRPTCPGQS